MSRMKRSIKTIDDVLYDDKRSRHSVSDDDANHRLRFDFVRDEKNLNNDENEETIDQLMTKLLPLKDQLYQVKSKLSDKEIAEWNKHTAFLNPAANIVSHLRYKLNVELPTQAWPKMYEILVKFQLITSSHSDRFISLHLCEAPGAFISALNHYLTTQNRTKLIDWQWFAQTLNPYYEHDHSTSSMLIDDDRLIFHTIDDDHWDFGEDNSGNLINRRNIEHYISRFQSMQIDLITADGSFDMLNNPGEQEQRVYPLLKSEILVALSCLSSHGNFVMKLFTIYEHQTIHLIFVLYQVFAQISFFKPTTSKRGNSEIYVICRDFQRTIWTESFSSSNFDSIKQTYPSSFVEQLIESCQLFQSSQIKTIESNLYWYNFHHYDRKFRKDLQRLKSQTLNNFLDQCQIEELLPSDRHLLKSDLFSHHFHRHSMQRTRFGTFYDQQQTFPTEQLRTMLNNGSFCLNCSGKDPICSICTILRDTSPLPSHIPIGTIKATEPVKIQCVYGEVSSKIENSCFADPILLKLFNEINGDEQISTINQNEFSLPSSLPTLPSRKLPDEFFRRLQDFLVNTQFQLHEQKGNYYLRSSILLRRFELSVLYTLLRIFDQAEIFVIPNGVRSFLLFQFQLGEQLQFDDFERVSVLVHLSDRRSNLLQFVHLHQLLDQSFIYHLIQGNNLCLQLTCITSTMYSVQSKK